VTECELRIDKEISGTCRVPTNSAPSASTTFTAGYKTQYLPTVHISGASQLSDSTALVVRWLLRYRHFRTIDRRGRPGVQICLVERRSDVAGESAIGDDDRPLQCNSQLRRARAPIPQSTCGIPSNAAVYSMNVTAVSTDMLGYLAFWLKG
jgi:hypothetical protein